MVEHLKIWFCVCVCGMELIWMVVMGVSLGDHFLCVSFFVIFSALVSTNFFWHCQESENELLKATLPDIHFVIYYL